MWKSNSKQNESEAIQNRFTAYVSIAIRRRRNEFIRQILRYQMVESMFTDIETKVDDSDGMEQKVIEGLPLYLRLENDQLLCALKGISDRERYVVLSKILNEKGFEELSSELGLGYKGVAALYYRAIKKLKKRVKNK